MEVKVDAEVESMMERAITKALIGRIDNVLPKVIEDLLSVKQNAYTDNMLVKSLKENCKRILSELVDKYATEHQAELEESIKRHITGLLDSDMIAKTVSTEISKVRVTVQPFSKKVASDEEDED